MGLSTPVPDISCPSNQSAVFVDDVPSIEYIRTAVRQSCDVAAQMLNDHCRALPQARCCK